MKYSLVVLLAFAFIGIACDDDETTPDPTPEGYEVGDRAFDFELMQPDGSMASLSDYRGKTVLLKFWALDCPKCIAEMPDVERLWNDYRDRDFVVIGLNDDVDEERWRQFVGETGTSGFERDWVQLHDSFERPNVFSRYRINKTPTQLLLDSDGIIIERDIEIDVARTKVEEQLGI